MRIKFRGFLLLYLVGLMPFLSQAQMYVKDSVISIPVISVNYSPHLPGGDLKDRVGFHNSIGVYAEYKTKKNWLYGIEGNFIFGSTVKDTNFLDAYKTERGEIISPNGGYATVFLLHRGWSINATVGKLLPIIGPNPNSGLLLKAGLGAMFHKIRVETQEDFVPFLQGDYLKGLDHFTLGVNLKTFMGYMHMSNEGFLRFYAGAEVITGFTRGMRDYLYDTRMPDQRERLDIMFGLRIGYIIPVYERTSNEYYTR